MAPMISYLGFRVFVVIKMTSDKLFVRTTSRITSTTTELPP